MFVARLRFAVALVIFLGWLTWLALAVAKKGDTYPVSRAQIANATHLVAARLTLGDDGLPAEATVVESLRGDLTADAKPMILNLSNAVVAGGTAPKSGEIYLLALQHDGKTYRIIGLPRSPGTDPADPPRPLIYPWDDGTRGQVAEYRS